MDKPVIIFGASTLAELVLEVFRAQKRNVIGCTADQVPDKMSEDLQFIGLFHELEIDLGTIDFCVCVGENNARKDITERIISSGGNVTNAIHPESFVSDSATIGNGNIIFPLSYLGTQVSIGDGNIIFPFVSLTHHSIIGNFTFFAPNTSVGGFSTIGNYAKFGMNSIVVAHSTIRQGTYLKPGEIHESLAT